MDDDILARAPGPGCFRQPLPAPQVIDQQAIQTENPHEILAVHKSVVVIDSAFGQFVESPDGMQVLRVEEKLLSVGKGNQNAFLTVGDVFQACVFGEKLLFDEPCGFAIGFHDPKAFAGRVNPCALALRGIIYKIGDIPAADSQHNLTAFRIELAGLSVHNGIPLVRLDPQGTCLWNFVDGNHNVAGQRGGVGRLFLVVDDGIAVIAFKSGCGAEPYKSA